MKCLQITGQESRKYRLDEEINVKEQGEKKTKQRKVNTTKVTTSKSRKGMQLI